MTRDWEQNGLPLPQLIFGGSLPEDQRKPSPWPVQQALRQFGLQPHDALVVDDLLPGLQMAVSAGVDFAGAGWSHDLPQIDGVMRQSGYPWFSEPEKLWQNLFD